MSIASMVTVSIAWLEVDREIVRNSATEISSWVGNEHPKTFLRKEKFLMLTDASFKRGRDIVAARGLVLTDSIGRLIHDETDTIQLEEGEGAFEAEARALEEGIKYVEGLGLDRVSFLCDSLDLVLACKNIWSSQSWKQRSWWSRNLKYRVNSLPEGYSFHHISREFNEDADYVASIGVLYGELISNLLEKNVILKILR